MMTMPSVSTSLDCEENSASESFGLHYASGIMQLVNSVRRHLDMILDKVAFSGKKLIKGNKLELWPNAKAVCTQACHSDTRKKNGSFPTTLLVLEKIACWHIKTAITL